MRYQCFRTYCSALPCVQLPVDVQVLSTSETTYSFFRQENRIGSPGAPATMADVLKDASMGLIGSDTNLSLLGVFTDLLQNHIAEVFLGQVLAVDYDIGILFVEV